MSDLPKGWSRTSLEAIVEPKGARVSPSACPDSPYLGLEHVRAHTNEIIATVPAASMASSSVRFNSGDVLYGRMRPYLNKVVRPAFEGLASAEFIVFPETISIDSDFLLKRLSSADFVEFSCSQYEGDRPRVKFDALGKFTINLPPRSEQTRIVAKLEELLSDLDAGVAELKAAKKKLSQYRQSLLKAAVDGSLTAEWRRNNPASETGSELLGRILKERRARWEEKQLAKFKEQGKTPPKDWQKKYSEPALPDSTDLPELPDGWAWASVEQISEIQGGIQKQPKRTPVDNKYPFLRVANVSRGKLKLDEIHEIELFPGEFDRLKLHIGDVLIVEGNGSLNEIGRCAVWDGSIENAVHQNHLIRVRPIIVVSQFLETWLNSLGGIEKLTKLAATTSGLYTLSVGKISKIPVPIAPVAEQQEASRILIDSLVSLNSQERSVEYSLKQSVTQRQNILRAAFAGQLVPQDPNDEPASALLERIRAERATQTKPKARGRKKVTA